jgi:hypothetical protein
MNNGCQSSIYFISPRHQAAKIKIKKNIFSRRHGGHRENIYSLRGLLPIFFNSSKVGRFSRRRRADETAINRITNGFLMIIPRVLRASVRGHFLGGFAKNNINGRQIDD